MLISTPFYGVITEDLGFYADVKLYHIHLDSEVGTRLLRMHMLGTADIFTINNRWRCLVFLFSSLGLRYFQASGEDGRLFHLTLDKLEEGLRKARQEVIHECIFRLSTCP